MSTSAFHKYRVPIPKDVTPRGRNPQNVSPRLPLGRSERSLVLLEYGRTAGAPTPGLPNSAQTLALTQHRTTRRSGTQKVFSMLSALALLRCTDWQIIRRTFAVDLLRDLYPLRDSPVYTYSVLNFSRSTRIQRLPSFVRRVPGLFPRSGQAVIF